MKFKLSAIFLAAMMVSSCSNDDVQEINQGNEITFNTRVSRAQNINSAADLQSFNVWAIWPKVEQTFIKNEVAKKNEGVFSFDRAVFWPNDVEQLNFYAVASNTNGTVEVTTQSAKISGFTVSDDVATQADLLVAYQEQKRSGSTSVALDFKHALSKIVIRAKAGVDDPSADENKKITLKGAWIANVRPKGDLYFFKENEPDDNSDTDITREFKPNWKVNTTTEKTYYGREFTNPIVLDQHATHDLLDVYKQTGEAPDYNMLLIPQQLGKWNIADNTDKKLNKNKGAYIMLLCRVEAEHKGSLHGTASDPAVKSDADANKHTHQMFPYTGTFNSNQYGYTCVPIDTNWEPGKTYIYTLTFCGQSSGAGIYPPVDDHLKGWPIKKDGETDLYISARPEGKKIGDPVLDKPISFTMTVTKWDDKEWTNGTSEQPAEEKVDM